MLQERNIVVLLRHYPEKEKEEGGTKRSLGKRIAR
jgi:hypothetical protein